MKSSRLSTIMNAIIYEILSRLERDEPVTKDLLDRIPRGVRLDIPIVVGTADGQEHRDAIIIENSVVTCLSAASNELRARWRREDALCEFRELNPINPGVVQ